MDANKADQDRLRISVPTWFEHESGPYIGRHRGQGPRDRVQERLDRPLRLEGVGRVLVGIAKNHHLNLLAEKARKLGRKLPIAVAIGNHPAVLLGSRIYLGLGDDEYDVVGGLLGRPLEIVRCKTVPLAVSAGADIVLEGHIDNADPIEEGDVSEFHGFYVRYGATRYIRQSCPDMPPLRCLESAGRLLSRQQGYRGLHCHNMLRLTEMGGIVMPPVPAFYPRPQTIEEMVTYTAARALDLFDIDIEVKGRWKDHQPRT